MSGIKSGTVFCISLGCAKNQVDSERLVGALTGAGFELADEAAGAETCIVNTCGFIREATEESVSTILDLIQMKAAGEIGRIGVMGCLLNRYGDNLTAELAEVDFWAGAEDYTAVLALMGVRGTEAGCRSEIPVRALLKNHPVHVRYLKIAEGCNNACSYCTIPSIRGRMRSLPVDFLVREAASLVEEGARELCVVAQDVAAYGLDRGERNGLIDLLKALEGSVPKGVWIRLFYLQPMMVRRSLIEYVASSSSVLPYLDIPIQHASDRILAAMNRRTTKQQLGELFRTARSIRPDIALRTTCMVGFPGETRGDFDELLQFLEEIRFDRVGSFLFSPEEGTRAIELPSPVSGRTQKSRRSRLMALQEGISLERQTSFIGSALEVIVDSVSGDTAESRSYREAPEVDGVIEIERVPPDLEVGEIVKIRVTDATEHDMTGEVFS